MSGSLRPISPYIEWTLPNDHPALQMLLEQITKLKEKIHLSELSAGMYYRQVQLLNMHVDLETCLEIHNKVWGKSTED